MKNKYGLLKVLIVLLAVVTAGVVYSCISSKKPETPEITDEQIMQEDVSALETETAAENLVCVHVCGSVRNPGVYYLPEGSRVHQAVELAGGFKEDAADSLINLADVLSDGEQLYIPSAEEAEDGSFRDITDRTDDGLVNINTADIKELTTLTGIGESKAEAIIAYRENVSAFESTEDITNVSGIGENVYEKIKDSIKVK